MIYITLNDKKNTIIVSGHNYKVCNSLSETLNIITYLFYYRLTTERKDGKSILEFKDDILYNVIRDYFLYNYIDRHKDEIKIEVIEIEEEL